MLNQRISNNYRNPIHAFRTILAREGFWALYRGLPVKLAYVCPAASVSFAVYENMKNVLDDAFQIRKNKKATVLNGPSSSSSESEAKNSSAFLSANGHAIWIAPLVSFGLFAGARMFGTFFRTPFDILKQQIQIEGQSATVRTRGSILATLKNIVRTEGAKGLFSGIGVTLLRDIPFASIYFTSYESIKRLQQRRINSSTNNNSNNNNNKNNNSSSNNSSSNSIAINNSNNMDDNQQQQQLSFYNAPSFIHLTSGALAGGIATGCTSWIDLIKTRLQTQSKIDPAVAEAAGMRRYSGFLDALQTIWREEGIAAFRRGLTPRLMYIMPSSAITFTVYEYLKGRF